MKTEFAPKFIKDYISILKKNPEEHNKDIVLDSIKKYLSHSKNAYIEYKEKQDKFPELHLSQFVKEYENIKNFAESYIKDRQIKNIKEV